MARGPPPHAADDDCAENGSAKRTAADALRNLRIRTAFALRSDSITHEIILSFWAGAVGGCFRFAVGKYKLETVVKNPPSFIWSGAQSSQPHHPYRGAAQPVLGIHRTVCYTTRLAPVQYESRVSLGYLNQSFQNAVRDGIRYGLEQGLFGWNVTDCKICFEYGVYYSPVSTPADFRSLAPIVLEQALKESGTQLLNLYLPSSSMRPRNTFPGLIMMHRNTVPPSKRPR